eukprot:COSAG02_NODE_6250_length_3699_cov_3.633611_1_plen_306_part_00
MSAEAQVWEEDRERQLEEIQALASIFGGEDEFTTSSSQLRSFVETGDHDFVDRSLAALSFELRVAVESVTGDGGDGSDVAPAGLCLSCTMPPGYPSRTAASMTGSIEHMLAKRADLTELNAMLAGELQSRVGDECIFEVADTAREWVAARIADLESASSTASEKATNQVEGDWGRGDSLTRSFFYCHHIRTKQARVYEWSEELRLSGRVKIGWPGASLYVRHVGMRSVRSCQWDGFCLEHVQDGFMSKAQTVRCWCLRSASRPSIGGELLRGGTRQFQFLSRRLRVSMRPGVPSTTSVLSPSARL